MKNGFFRAPESESGLRIGLRAVVLQMSEKSIYRKMGWAPSLRELIFLKMVSFLYIFQILHKKDFARVRVIPMGGRISTLGINHGKNNFF